MNNIILSGNARGRKVILTQEQQMNQDILDKIEDPVENNFFTKQQSINT